MEFQYSLQCIRVRCLRGQQAYFVRCLHLFFFFYLRSDKLCPTSLTLPSRTLRWRMSLFSHILWREMSCSTSHEISSLAHFQKVNAIMTIDNIQASKGQACVCVMHRHRCGNWLQNRVWCGGNLSCCDLQSYGQCVVGIAGIRGSNESFCAVCQLRT